jgi:diguanylate cyclase (GGDEF)-like protein
MNRTRMEKIVERLKYWDDDGYTNLRYFYAQIMKMRAEGTLTGKAAARINLKHFSVVNDQVGKKAGDIVLRRYMNSLYNSMGEGSVLSRLGGDNFVLLFGTDRLPGVMKVLSGIPVPYSEDHRIEVSAIAGVCTITNPDEIANPGIVMEQIITPYLIAKREDTEDIIFYSEKIKEAKENSKRVHRKFKKALEKEEFEAYYQPKVDIRTNKIIGAEALCRWLHKGRMIPPGDFIPDLEQGRDICRLDFYMLNRVCEDLRRWMDEGKPVVTVSVNLSRRHLVDPDLFEHIVEIIDRHDIPHHLIEIELTETTTDVEFKDLKKLVSSLQDAGISASVDDFGIGYSSLNLIKQIPWDVLKLDKSIVPANGEDMERGTHLFHHVIAMAHDIGLQCIAEGVETEDQLEIMRQYGCRYVQGYIFDKPMPVEDFEKKLREGKYPG